MKVKKLLPLILVGVISILFYMPGCDNLITESNTQVLYDSTLGQECNRCHGDADNRYLRPREQWRNSAHASEALFSANVMLNGLLKNVPSCGARCHTHEGYTKYIQSGSGASVTSPNVIGCFTCHAPHSGNYGTWSDTILRGDSAFILLTEDAVYSHGRSNMCAHCHQARGLPPKPDGAVDISSDWGPHFSPQADVLIGHGGYFWKGEKPENSHDQVADGCLGCHFADGKGYEFGEHTFRLRNDDTGEEFKGTCEVSGCHASSRILDSLADYSSYDSIPVYADSLQFLLRTWGYLDPEDPTGRTFVPQNDLDADIARVLYNYLLFKLDGSRGVHNPAYFQTLLSQSVARVESLPPVPHFVMSDTSGCVPLEIEFTDLSYSLFNVAYWTWYFGNGDSSTQENPTYTYEEPGVYTIGLKVVDGNGTSEITSESLVVASGPIATIGVDSTEGYVPLTVVFTDSSTCVDDPATTWRWDFGDGDSSLDQNPGLHTYDSPGDYTVTLEIENPYDTVTATRRIEVKPPKADFIVNRRFGFSGTTFRFTDLSEPADKIVSWRWDFGDNTTEADTSTEQNPSWTYSRPGLYDVTLEVGTSGFGTDTARQAGYINIFTPQAVFEADSTEGCAPLATFFRNRSIDTANIDSAIWDFGDGTDPVVQYKPFGDQLIHTYDTAGSFTVTLGVYGDWTEDEDTVIVESNITTKNELVYAQGPDPGFEYDTSSAICIGAGFEVYPSGEGCPATGHEWQILLDDTTVISASASDTGVFAFDSVGAYIVRHIATSQYGVDTLKKKIQVEGPSAAFTASSTMPCVGDTVYFTSTSDCHIDEWEWDWGDGSGSTTVSGDSIPHVFNSGGLFDVQLIVSDFHGNGDTVTIEEMIEVRDIVANFSVSDRQTCTNTSIVFSDASSCISPANAEWIWNFGDGEADTTDVGQTTHSYGSTGAFTPMLIVNNTVTGGADTVSKSSHIDIYGSAPTALIDTAGEPRVGVTILFEPVTSGVVDSFFWDFNDSLSSNPTSTDSIASHTFSAPGTYNVSLRVANDCGDYTTTLELEIAESGGVSRIEPIGKPE